MSRPDLEAPSAVPGAADVTVAAFQQGLEALPVPQLMADGRGRIIFTNASLDQLFGYERSELIGSAVEVLLPLGDRLGHPELREAYLQLPQRRAMSRDRELCGLSKTGGLVPIEVSLNSVEFDGEVFVIAAVVDVGRMADKLNRSRQALDAASSAMVMVDADGTIVLVNAKVTEMFGYSRDRLIGSSIEMLIPEELRRRHEVYRRSYGADPSERRMETGRDLHGRRADGSEFPLEIGLMPVDGIGERLVMATVIDTSERKRAELEIEQRNAELVELNAELEQVAYSASHDLKAPLTTLDGLLSCVVDDLASGDLAAVELNVDRSQMLARRLVRLIEGVLGLAAPEQTEMAWVDLPRLIGQAVESLDTEFRDHDTQVSIDIPPCEIFTEPLRVAQIVQNLLSNGAKFSDHTKPERWVSVRAELRGGRLLILVADNGIGIPAGYEREAFSLFRRFDNHQQSGSGVGLALVKRHAERLGGTVEFDSSPSGTSFRVRLPATSRGPSVEAGAANARSES